MATDVIAVTEGSGKNVAMHSFSEDAVTKQLQRIVVNNAAGADIALATTTKQDTIIGHLDGVEGLLTSIDGDTGNISDQIDILVGAVDGTEIQVDIVSSVLPTGAATEAKQDTGNTALAAIKTAVEIIDDIVLTEDAAHSSGQKGVMPLAVRNDSRGALAGTDGDYSPLQLNASGDLRVDGSAVTQPISAAALPLPSGAATAAKQDTGNTSLASIDGKITAVNTGAVVVSSSALPTGAATAAKQDTGNASVASIDGKITACNTGAVVISSGTITTVSTVSAVTDAQVQGKAAHDAAVSGNPVLIGAEARDANGTAVSVGDAVRINADRFGRLRTVKAKTTQASSNGTPLTSSGNATAIAAPSSGTHLKIHRIFAANSSATATWVYWRDGSAGTKLYPMYLLAGANVTFSLDGTWELTTATALVMNLSANGSVEWHVDYETVAD